MGVCRILRPNPGLIRCGARLPWGWGGKGRRQGREGRKVAGKQGVADEKGSRGRREEAAEMMGREGS